MTLTDRVRIPHLQRRLDRPHRRLPSLKSQTTPYSKRKMKMGSRRFQKSRIVRMTSLLSQLQSNHHHSIITNNESHHRKSLTPRRKLAKRHRYRQINTQKSSSSPISPPFSPASSHSAKSLQPIPPSNFSDLTFAISPALYLQTRSSSSSILQLPHPHPQRTTILPRQTTTKLDRKEDPQPPPTQLPKVTATINRSTRPSDRYLIPLPYLYPATCRLMLLVGINLVLALYSPNCLTCICFVHACPGVETTQRPCLVLVLAHSIQMMLANRAS